MQYNRSESFRYQFKIPLAANFKILMNGRIDGIDQAIYRCTIHDISPRGMRMFSDLILGEHNKILQVEVQFILDEVAITAVGDIVWERPFANGKMCGLIFRNQPKLEEVIISGLKARRRKEVLNKR